MHADCDSSTLNGSTDGDSFVGFYTLEGLTTENRLDRLDNLDTWHTCHTTDKDDLIDVQRLDTGVSRRLVAGIDSTLVS